MTLLQIIISKELVLILVFNPSSVTRGNNYRLLKQRCHYDLIEFSFTNRIVNIWSSLPNMWLKLILLMNSS